MTRPRRKRDWAAWLGVGVTAVATVAFLTGQLTESGWLAAITIAAGLLAPKAFMRQ